MANKKPAAKKPAPQLRVDPGRPPGGDEPAGDEPGGNRVDEQQQQPGVVDAAVDTLERWEQETVELLLGVVFLALNLTLGRGGPEDAFLPAPKVMGEMAGSGTRLLNRSLRARAVAKFGDGIAFLTATGGFIGSEARKTKRYRSGHVDEPPAAPRVEDEINDLFTAERREGDEQPPQIRNWRPPNLPPPEQTTQ